MGGASHRETNISSPRGRGTQIFPHVTTNESVAVHSEVLDCVVGLRPPRNDDKLVALTTKVPRHPELDSGSIHLGQTNIDRFRGGKYILTCRYNSMLVSEMKKHGMTEEGGVPC